MVGKNEIENIRHSFAHVLATAVLRAYPKAKLAIGPAIDTGFYYDFDLSTVAPARAVSVAGGSAKAGKLNIGEEDLPALEEEMRAIIKQDLPFRQEKWPLKKAREHFKGAPYKLELIDELEGEGETEVGIVFTGDEFVDLCRGGHVQSTGMLPSDAFALTKTAGAYWRGSEKNTMLTRVYGAAFATQKELGEYQMQQEQASERDHKKLGRELGLFATSDLVGPGLPLFTPKGTILFRQLAKFSEELKREIGFQEVHIPHIAKLDLYKTSGHAEKFKDDIFYVKGKDSQFILKPMNCPHHIQVYASSPRSYRDLPVKFFETTTVYRDEQAGELGGLTRVRSITMDDSHAFARPDQIEELFDGIIKQIMKVVDAFGIGEDYYIRLSLRDESNKDAYLGTDELWHDAQKRMEDLLKKRNVKYETAEGEAAFYGPKMDFMITDAIGREWQIATAQLDVNLPERFKLEYTDADGTAKQPIMIHSAFLGSVERFMGIIIEHFAGAFPTWLAPEQVWVLPISDKFNKYADTVTEKLALNDIRVVKRDENESLGKKIRLGETQRIPYLLVVGEKEEKDGTVSVRSRKDGDKGAVATETFTQTIVEEIEERK
jgi:threonyl-tRNA synthetase